MLVGVCGFIGSGKGTVADILKNDYGFETDSYAAPVKDAVAAIFGFNRELLEGDTLSSRTWRETPSAYWSLCFDRPFSPREALQLMGTECGRNVYHPNLWVDALELRLNHKPNSDVVITDVRFPNEIAQIHRLGGKIVRVWRGTEPLWFEYAAAWNQKDHSSNGENPQVMPHFPGIHYSEFAWIGQIIDYTIDNNGSLEDLKVSIDFMVCQSLGIVDRNNEIV